MRRYFFDLINGTGLTCDEEGAELADEAAARDYAVRQLRSVVAHEVLNGELDRNIQIVVRTSQGRTMEVGLRDAVRMLPEDGEGRR